MAKVFLGVGHGGKDPGAIGEKYKESFLNLEIAKAVRDVLEYHGVKVKMSRETNEDDTLEEEIKEAIAYKPTLAIDIHCNAGGGDGFEVFHSFKYKKDDALAKNIEAEVKKIGQNSRGLKTKLIAGTTRDWYGFVRQINEALNIPSLLIECAFVDTNDVKILNTPSKRKTFGTAIAKGILKYLGINYNAKAATTFKVGDKVKITGKYAASATSAVVYSGAIGYERYITRIHTGKANPYQLGLKVGSTSATTTTGFAPSTSIKKV